MQAPAISHRFSDCWEFLVLLPSKNKSDIGTQNFLKCTSLLDRHGLEDLSLWDMECLISCGKFRIIILTNLKEDSKLCDTLLGENNHITRDYHSYHFNYYHCHYYFLKCCKILSFGTECQYFGNNLKGLNLTKSLWMLEERKTYFWISIEKCGKHVKKCAHTSARRPLP